MALFGPESGTFLQDVINEVDFRTIHPTLLHPSYYTPHLSIREEVVGYIERGLGRAMDGNDTAN